MTSSAIAVSGLRKAYGDKAVLDGIDLAVPAGTIFSLLGPNGAGKTTTVNVLTTLIKADSGTVRVAGHDIATEAKAVRAAIGVTGQFAAVDDLLTGEENLQLMADLHHLRRDEGQRMAASLLARFDLAESAQKMAATYSGGMRRKLDLAMTLVARPRIIFLDEPTAGLDPRSRRTMWDIVRELVAERRLRDYATWFEREGDQQRAQPGARHVGEDAVVRANLEWPEHPDLHVADLPPLPGGPAADGSTGPSTGTMEH
jgi:ABC-2 type transport system ATP-binding protein